MIKGQQLHEERIQGILVFIRTTDKNLHLEKERVYIYPLPFETDGEEYQQSQKELQ